MSARPAFLPVWTIAMAATVSAFVLHLAFRGKTVERGIHGPDGDIALGPFGNLAADAHTVGVVAKTEDG